MRFGSNPAGPLTSRGKDRWRRIFSIANRPAHTLSSFLLDNRRTRGQPSRELQRHPGQQAQRRSSVFRSKRRGPVMALKSRLMKSTRWSASWGAADLLGQVQDRRRPKRIVTEFYRSAISWSGRRLTGFHASENICWAVVIAIRPTPSRAVGGSRH